MEQLIDILEAASTFIIEEADKVKYPGVLAIATGPAFFKNGVSQNNRLYSEGLWEKVLSNIDITTKLKERRLFGTISHETPINDASLEQGRVSHIITDLKMNEDGKGIAKFEILDTPAGRIVNTLLRAGVKMFVSTRGSGDFKGHKNGVPVVDEDKYQLHSIDWVLTPGFATASPGLVESLKNDRSLKKDLDYCFGSTIQNEQNVTDPVKDKDFTEDEKTNLKTGESLNMSKELIESLAGEKLALASQLQEAINANSALEQTKSLIDGENKFLKERSASFDALQAELNAFKAVAPNANDLKKMMDEAASKIAFNQASVESYKKLIEGSGDPVKLVEELTALKAGHAKYTDIGTAEEIDSILDESIAAQKVVNKFIDDVGSFEDIDATIDAAMTELKEWHDVAATPEEASVYMKAASTIISKLGEEKTAKEITALAAELKVTEEAIKSVHGRLSIEEIKGLFSKLSEATSVQGRFSSTKPLNEKGKEEGKQPSKNSMDESLGRRLMEKFSS